MVRRQVKIALAASIGCALPCPSRAALTFYVEPNNPWPSGWYSAAVADMRTVVNMYNAYGDFGNGSIYVYYNVGIPTAQSGYGGYGGSIGVGGTYPNVRVLLHESSHWLGTGTYSSYWTGPHASALIQQFDGVGAVLNGDGQHYWPYGENYDNESSPINDARHVAMVYALREDFGIGSTAPPSSARNVTLTANDAAGTSGFNHPWGWSDGHFPQAGTNYYTGNFALRTPNGYPSWTFAGASLTVNNHTNPNGGLLFNGWGSTGVVTINNLVLDGGSIIHDQNPQDLFQLAGRISVVSNSTIDAARGNIRILSTVGGVGSLTKTGPYKLTLAGPTFYAGTLVNSAGTLDLASPGGASLAGLTAAACTVTVGGPTGMTGPLTITGVMTIDDNAVVKLLSPAAPNANTSVSQLVIGNTGLLDLTSNRLHIHYGDASDPSATIAAYIASAYHGGEWNGAGIHSSGVDSNHGLALAHDAPGDLLLAPAIYGDTNLDGSVNFTDLLDLAQHYGQTNATWEQGDFNYDGIVGFADLLDLAQHYGQSLPAAQLASLQSAAVPEPSPLLLLPAIAGFQFRRRKWTVSGQHWQRYRKARSRLPAPVGFFGSMLERVMHSVESDWQNISTLCAERLDCCSGGRPTCSGARSSGFASIFG